MKRATVILALLLAGCAVPHELKRPVAQPTLADPVPVPELPRYDPPIPHEVPRSDRAATR